MKNIVENSIKQYNKYYFPEAKAKLVSISGKALRVGFARSFYHTCGFYDCFGDYKISLDAHAREKYAQ